MRSMRSSVYRDTCSPYLICVGVYYLDTPVIKIVVASHKAFRRGKPGCASTFLKKVLAVFGKDVSLTSEFLKMKFELPGLV